MNCLKCGQPTKTVDLQSVYCKPCKILYQWRDISGKPQLVQEIEAIVG